MWEVTDEWTLQCQVRSRCAQLWRLVSAMKIASVLIFTSSSSGFLSGPSVPPPHQAPSMVEDTRNPRPSETTVALLQLCQVEEVQVSRNIFLKGRNPEQVQAPPPAEGQLDKDRRRRSNMHSLHIMFNGTSGWGWEGGWLDGRTDGRMGDD